MGRWLGFTAAMLLGACAADAGSSGDGEGREASDAGGAVEADGGGSERSEDASASPDAGSIPVDDACGDGLDNDGDGTVDEECYCRPGALARCYGGDPSTREVGTCRDGQMTCGEGEFPMWGDCTGDVLPDTEVCGADGLDEDCDGSVDEGCECVGDAPIACGSDEGECVSGTQSCTDGVLGACEGAVGPVAETCNGLDDDCDGSIDEELARGCGSSTGECSMGTSRCAAGSWLACEGAVGPSVESCNGLDDDCDGSIDEGTEVSCGSDIGACAPGVSLCTGGVHGACEGAIDPAIETCNGVDDDCDGTVDEGLSRACGSSVGECREGTETCHAGTWGTCTGSVGPGTEDCNGGDEDCDGLVDEGCSCRDGDTIPCGTDTGACIAGRQTCASGVWGACSGATGPTAEICNGVDDDCDGTVDEGLTRACGSDVGACSMGTSTCAAGTWGSCVGEVAPVTETCNAVDDDCDGTIDEGLTRACGSDVGACERGVRTCSVGVWGACAGEVVPTTETCNGLDDDCDGSVDEGLTMACGSDVGECSTGVRTCSGGVYGACVGSIPPSTEDCDGGDEDCDGMVDEGCDCFDGTTTSCGTDVGECQRGRQTCVSGSWGACTGGIAPSAEICNTLDDDCDGSIDEGACLTYTVAIEPERDLDLLFVIDNSGSMSEEQASLTASYPSLLSALERAPGGLPSLHVGVTSSDVSTTYSVPGCTAPHDGRLQNTARISGCRPPSGYFIEDVIQPDGTRRRNYTGTLGDTFACIATLGRTGCGFEQHLEGMKLALDGTHAINAGFLRPDAFLAVVFLADEDDCSASDRRIFDPYNTSVGPLSSFRCAEYGVSCDGAPLPRAPGSYSMCEPQAMSPYIHHPDRYVSFLQSLKADPSRLIAAGILGNASPFSASVIASGNVELDPSCSSASGVAYPAVRFRHLLDAFPGRSAFTSICSGDLSGALTVIGDTIATAMSSACLPHRPLDTDPSTPGLDADCTVEDVAGYGTPMESVMGTIPECGAGVTGACFEIVEMAPGCPTAPSLELRVHRNGTLPPRDTTPVIRCRWPG